MLHRLAVALQAAEKEAVVVKEHFLAFSSQAVFPARSWAANSAICTRNKKQGEMFLKAHWHLPQAGYLMGTKPLCPYCLCHSPSLEVHKHGGTAAVTQAKHLYNHSYTGFPQLIPNPCAIAVADLELRTSRKTPPAFTCLQRENGLNIVMSLN